jgi:hypothetical protein
MFKIVNDKLILYLEGFIGKRQDFHFNIFKNMKSEPQRREGTKENERALLIQGPISKKIIFAS